MPVLSRDQNDVESWIKTKSLNKIDRIFVQIVRQFPTLEVSASHPTTQDIAYNSLQSQAFATIPLFRPPMCRSVDVILPMTAGAKRGLYKEKRHLGCACS